MSPVGRNPEIEGVLIWKFYYLVYLSELYFFLLICGKKYIKCKKYAKKGKNNKIRVDREVLKMVGYLLMAIGGWLIYDDYKIAKAKKLAKEGGEDGIHENGNDRSSGHRVGKSGELHKKSNRNGRVKPIGIPVAEIKGGQNGISKKSVQKVESDKNRNSTGNDSSRQSDSTTVDNQSKSLKTQKIEKEGGQDAEHKVNNENGISNDGNHVSAESSSRNAPDRTKID